MQIEELIHEIQLLPMSKKVYLIEETLKSIKKEELTLQMESAAEELSEEYLTNKNLTAFTELDLESFYEAK